MASETAKNNKAMEKIVGEFQSLRNEQRNYINNLSTLEMDLKEHKTVIDTLKTVDENRKCYRLVGGVLCAKTVKDVLPQLTENRNKLETLVKLANEQITKKGQEINKFRETHNLKIRGQETVIDKPEPNAAVTPGSGAQSQEKSNVLVADY